MELQTQRTDVKKHKDADGVYISGHLANDIRTRWRYECARLELENQMVIIWESGYGYEDGI
jgi:hypothetical protein